MTRSHRSKNLRRAKPKRRRAQDVIPFNRELNEHADAIRTIGRQSFEGMVEIGRRLVRCRHLLKGQRRWLAWIKVEFGWSRAHADRAIALYTSRDKVHKLSTLGVPLSALYLLARAEPEARRRVTQLLEAGERPTTHKIKTVVQYTKVPLSAPAVVFEPGQVIKPVYKPPPVIDVVPASVAELAGRIEAFAAYVRGQAPPKEIAASIPPEQRSTVATDACAIATYLSALARSLSGDEGPKLIADGQTKH